MAIDTDCRLKAASGPDRCVWSPVAKLLLAIACSRERLRNKVGQPQKHARVKDLTVANCCVLRHPNYVKNLENELLHLKNELLQNSASQKGSAIAQCFSILVPVSEADNYLALARRTL